MLCLATPYSHTKAAAGAVEIKVAIPAEGSATLTYRVKMES